MRVKKRSGIFEDMKFDKVTARISNLTYNLKNVAAIKVAQQVFSSMYDGITTHEIDNLTAEIAVGMMTTDTEYEVLAARIVASNIQKTAPKTFKESMKNLHENGVISDDTWSVVDCNDLDESIISENDFSYGYFGLKTLEKAYLQKVNGTIMETPQYMFMRVSIGIHGADIQRVIETYTHMSRGMFTHATPTLFNSGTINPQMSSCFLLAMKEDSICGIYDTLKRCANISKYAGGIGLHVHNVRSKGSKIRGTNGVSDGIIPMLRVFNSTARYVNQAGKRNGSIAIYLEPWHKDIMGFLELRLNQGDEEARARDLFTAMWIPDLFMRRVEEGGDWTLMCPDECPGLSDSYGSEFEELYTRYETEGRGKTVPALAVWRAILKSQIETGTPYMFYKDSVNAKTNHQNLGVIKSSNLCGEICEYTNSDEVAVCNLASIALPKFIRDGQVDHETLHATVKIVTRNLNRVIDRNFYPIEEARLSNMRHRPIGIGVQGLADLFIMLRIPFDGQEAQKINVEIFETLYHGALEASCELAEVDGSYETFQGSPLSQGVLQFDMWKDPKLSGRYDWNSMRERVKRGIRNSLLMAPMPTASTAQILGNNEAFEPYTTNIYLRRTMAGEFVVVNKHLVADLSRLGLWSKEVKDMIIKSNGSIQNIAGVPDDIKALYKTVWEMSQKAIIDMARDRGAFICQSQSMNLFMESPTANKLSSMHMYAWKQGLKTGMYYLRSRPKANPIQFTIEPCISCGA